MMKDKFILVSYSPAIAILNMGIVVPAWMVYRLVEGESYSDCIDIFEKTL